MPGDPALDDVEASMRPDGSRGAGGRVEQVKLLRSEYAAVKSIQSQFSRTLFVANLPQVLPPSPMAHMAWPARSRPVQTAVDAPACSATLLHINSLPGMPLGKPVKKASAVLQLHQHELTLTV